MLPPLLLPLLLELAEVLEDEDDVGATTAPVIEGDLIDFDGDT